MHDITGFMPAGFRLRRGKGKNVKNGLCFMETVALIAGEEITDHPKCACPALTYFGIVLNDLASDELRNQLLPLAWATAGTRSPEHLPARRRLLLAAVSHVRDRITALGGERRRVTATDDDWFVGTESYKIEISSVTGFSVSSLDRWRRKMADIDARLARAYERVEAGVPGEEVADRLLGELVMSYDRLANRGRTGYLMADRFLEVPLIMLREAIKAGPHGGLPDEVVETRIRAVADKLPVVA